MPSQALNKSVECMTQDSICCVKNYVTLCIGHCILLLAKLNPNTKQKKYCTVATSEFFEEQTRSVASPSAVI